MISNSSSLRLLGLVDSGLTFIVVIDGELVGTAVLAIPILGLEGSNESDGILYDRYNK